MTYECFYKIFNDYPQLPQKQCAMSDTFLLSCQLENPSLLIIRISNQCLPQYALNVKRNPPFQPRFLTFPKK